MDILKLEVPKIPPRELLVSMAMRLHHDFGLEKYKDATFGFTQGFTKEEREQILIDMERCYDEITGQGFYSWNKDNGDMYKI